MLVGRMITEFIATNPVCVFCACEISDQEFFDAEFDEPAHLNCVRFSSC